ncbi:MAG: Fe-S cluster assembly ATPase SufC [Candidatus Diapherotrites archaeon]|nr:Fe-S cluster assembly ATPase SufC [Candidatus Diapherotrites archaeon]
MLEITGLHASVDGKEILHGVDLTVNRGEVHAIMGPNGSGKSTLSAVIMGHPNFEVTSGSIRAFGKNVLELEPNERAKLGLFLSFQYPFEIEGLGFSKFLHTAYKNLHPNEQITVLDFQKIVKEKLKELELSEEFLKRQLNVGFSGGEKKRAEIAQLLVLKPKFAILDETDSGLDIDSLRLVANTVNKLRGPAFSALVITHYKRILNYLKPDFIHVMIDGKIVESGTAELAEKLEENGYSWLLEKHGKKAVAEAVA